MPESSAAGVAWDLSALFSGINDPALESAWTSINSQADAFAEKYRGKVADLNAADLAEAIRESERLSTAVYKPMSYAHLLYSADASKPEHGAFVQAQSEQASAVRIKIIFFDLELQKIEEARMQELLADPALADYGHYLSEVRKYTPHTLPEEQEALLEEVSNTGSRAWVRLHDEVLANHKFTYANPKSGEDETLTQEEILTLLRDADRDVRQAAAKGFTKGLKELERVIVFTYNTLLADKKLGDRLRDYPEADTSRHMANEMEPEWVAIVMELCQERSDLVARYYKAKRDLLDLGELTHIDRYAPLHDAEEKVEWSRGKEIVLDSFGGFSSEMRDRAEEFFTKEWIDADPREGKTGGAFCNYITPDLHPVMMMNYMDKMDDVMTLAHELGHGVHASLSRSQSLFNFHGSLPLAELASIFGEMLVFEALVKDASERDKQALYADKLEGIFASVHRQAAMYRFEKRCHEHRRTKGELSADDFAAIWQDEMQSMFEDSVSLGEDHRIWWLYVGHFFFAPFYVYAYSFGELLTLSLYDKAKGDPDFADKYLKVLELGGSESPKELMARLDVDLGDRSFWEGGFRVIERLQGEFEALQG